MDAIVARKVIRLRFRRLRRYYHPIYASYDMGAIHDFRVEFKKLRAFLRLLSAGRKNIKIPGSLKKLYQYAGRVRDLQLHREYLERQKTTAVIPAAILRRLNQKLAVAKRELKKAMDLGMLVSAQKKIEKKIHHDYPDKTVEEFITSKTAAIRAIISTTNLRDNDLHSIRKHIKDIVYDARIFKTEMKVPFSWPEWNVEKEKNFGKLADKLGKFQDSCTLLAHLRTDASQAVSHKEKAVITGIRTGMFREKKKIKDAIRERLMRPEGFLKVN